jgi:uncharacterized membrane protein YdbT with pleckstrin-like domain
MIRDAYYPSVSEIVNHDIESGGSFSVNRSLKSLLPQIGSFLSAVAVLYLIEFGTAYFLGFGWRRHIPIVGDYAFRLFAVVPIVLLLELIRKYNDDVYVFERDRVIHHDGVLSFTYNVPAIRYFDIRAVQVKQGIVGRILGYGDIELSTAAQDRAEVILQGVAAPRSLAAFIEEMRAWHHERDSFPSEFRSPPGSSERFSEFVPESSRVE